jgi:hypothetical protein
VLEATWDGAAAPQVSSPLGPFFGFDWETAEYGSVPAGCLNGQAYQYFPMPFRKSAKFRLQSYLEMPATVEAEFEWAAVPSLPSDTAYFYARWRHEPDSKTFDYPFLETAGRGHFVGVCMPIDHPLEGWWGEGDEKVWVDDDDFPPFIGTGSEDYFGDAWGIRYLSGPSYGASSFKGHRTCNYRWHFADLIPFEKRMRMTIENYGPNGQGPQGQYDYSSTAFWYQAEPTPNFASLRGVGVTGGTTPEAKPTRMEYNPAPFPKVDADNIRTYGLGITFAIQAEELFKDTLQQGKAKIITDAKLPYEFDRERAVEFGEVKPGAKFAQTTLNVAAAGVYQPRIYTAPGPGIAEMSLQVGDAKPLEISRRSQTNAYDLTPVFLEAGPRRVSVVALTEGRGVMDCLQLGPASRVAGVIEAEELQVTSSIEGAPTPRPSEPQDGASGGRVLEFRPEKAGQGFVLRLGKRPALPYVLGFRAVRGPRSGNLQALVGGKPFGPQYDLYASEPKLDSVVLPVGELPAEVQELGFRVVDQNEESKGFEADIDYFRWEPAILGPGTAEGIWARVLETHACEYRAQDLGSNYSGGHQFWVQPSNRDAWVDIAIGLREARTYEFEIRYTKSWDYAVIQAFLDGKPMGARIDTYAPSVMLGDPVVLGKLALEAGQHVLRFQAVDHNEKSEGYLMGIDHVIVR